MLRSRALVCCCAQAVRSARWDFEEGERTFNITICVEDAKRRQETFTLEKTFTVEIQDVNEKPLHLSLTQDEVESRGRNCAC